MKNKILIGIAVILIAFLAYKAFHTPNHGFGGASLSCSDGTATCLPTLELTGSTNTSLNSLQVDTGASSFAGATSFAGASTLTSTFKLGTSGTVQSNQIATTCSPIADVSITSSSTGYAYCTGVTGVTSADSVLAQFSTSTANFVASTDNFWIVSAKASTTAGAIDFLVYNGTNQSRAPSTAGRSASTTVIRAGH